MDGTLMATCTMVAQCTTATGRWRELGQSEPGLQMWQNVNPQSALTCDFIHLLLPVLPVQLLRLTFAIGTLPGTRCGFRKCDPYEWRRDEDSLERNLWYGPCPRVAHKQAVSAKLRHLSMQPYRDVTVQEGLAQC